MSTTIVSSIGTSMSAATGRPMQGHLVYAQNLGAWWLTYLSGTNALSALYSSSFTGGAWTAPTGSPFTLAKSHTSEGRNFGFAYANLASTDVLHMASAYPADGANYHARFTLGATWARTNAEGLITSHFSPPSYSSPCTALDSGGTPVDTNSLFYDGSNFGNLLVAQGTHADSGTSWTAGYGSPINLTVATNATTSTYVESLGSTNLIAIGDHADSSDGVFKTLDYSKYTGSWSASAKVFGVGVTVTGTSAENWGAVAASTSDIHVVALSNNSNAYLHRRYDGSSWGAGNTIPALAYHANSGLFLATDGTNVWLFAIDTSNNVKYIKWTAATPAWDAAWTTLDAGGSSARTYITGFNKVVTNTIGVIWTQANGTNYDIVGTILSIPATVSATASASGSATATATGSAIDIASDSGSGDCIAYAWSIGSAPDVGLGDAIGYGIALAPIATFSESGSGDGTVQGITLPPGQSGAYDLGISTAHGYAAWKSVASSHGESLESIVGDPSILIFSAVGSGMIGGCGSAHQQHMFWAVNQARWIIFALTGTQTLSMAYSPDFVTWTIAGGATIGSGATGTGGSLTLLHPHGSIGRNFAFAYDNIAGTDVVHMMSDYNVSSTKYSCHARITIPAGGTSFTVTNAEAQVQSATDSTVINSGCCTILDSNNRPIEASGYLQVSSAFGDLTTVRGNNTDAGTSWTAGFATATKNIVVTNFASSMALLPAVAAGDVLGICDNSLNASGSFTQLQSTFYTTSWSAAASVLAATVTSVGVQAWCAVARTITDIHVFAVSNGATSPTTFVHRTTANGTTWATATAPPSLTTYFATGGLFAATDGTNIWLFALDTSFNLRFVQWNGSSWGSWATSVGGAGVQRNYLTGYQSVVNGNIALMWMELVASNYNIVGSLFSTTPGSTASASGSAVAFGTGGSLKSGTASASGTSLISGTGSSLALATATASGTSVASVQGSSLALATASASGSVTASATGAAQALATASTSGLGTSSATGSSLSLATASAFGSATASAVGQLIATATAVGTSSVSAVGQLIATASASGTSSASAVGQLIATASASGTSSVSATGSFLSLATASASGTSTASATGSSQSLATATASGTSSALAVGQLIATASASGTSTASATGVALSLATASASGTSSSSATGSSLSSATASASGTSTSSAVGQLVAIASDSGIGAASGTGTSIAQATASASGQADVSGVGIFAGTNIVSAFGSATASAVGQLIATAVDSGSATVSGTATSLFTANATDGGLATASGSGAALSLATASDGGVGAASGVGTSSFQAIASDGGVGAASGVSATISGSVASDGGVGAASGVGSSLAAATAFDGGIATATASIPTVSATASASGSSVVAGWPIDHYSSIILKTPGIQFLWPLNEDPVVAVTDWSDSNQGTYHGNVVEDQPGIPGSPYGSATFNVFQSGQAIASGSALAFGTNGATSPNFASDGGRGTATGFAVKQPGYVTTSQVINEAGPCSVECWAKLPALPPNTNTSYLLASFAQGNNSNVYDKTLAVRWVNDAHVIWYVYDGISQIIVAGTYTVGAWHHLVGTVDGTNSHLYMDGVLVANQPCGFSANTYTVPSILIGGNLTSGGLFVSGLPQYLVGSLAYVAVYNQALDLATVRNHYAAGLGLPVASASGQAAVSGVSVVQHIASDGGVAAVSGVGIQLAPHQATVAASGRASVSGSGQYRTNDGIAYATIVNGVAAGLTSADIIGNPSQQHILYGANNGLWYLFQPQGTGLQTLNLYYSSDFSTWTSSGTTLTLAAAPTSARNLGFGYLNKASTDVVHLCTSYSASSNDQVYHARFTLGPTSFTVTNAEAQTTTISAIEDGPGGSAVGFLADGTPVDASSYLSYSGAVILGMGDIVAVVGTNPDSGTAWTAGFGTTTRVESVDNYNTSNALARIGASDLILVADDSTNSSGHFQGLFSSVYSGGTWSTAILVFSSSITQTVTNNWDMVARTSSDIHVVALSDNASNFVHRRYDGASWSDGSPIPPLALAASSGVVLSTDGTFVYCSAIGSDNHIYIIRWNGSAWDGIWTTVNAVGISPRSYLSGDNSIVSGNVALIWAQQEGSNYDVDGVLYPVALISGPSVASAAGSATVSAIGQEIVVASASGVGATSGAGSALSTGVGSASGTATAAGSGSATALATASASGSAIASATGSATIPATASASGSAAAIGSGSATAPATATASGSSTASATGSATALVTASASGTGSVSGFGSSFLAGVASDSGSAAVSGFGIFSGQSLVTDAGHATVAATGQIIVPVSATGQATASGSGSSLALATASAVGSSTSSGVGASSIPATATSSGSGAVSGVGRSTFLATASATGGPASASAFTTSVSIATASSSGLATVSGSGTSFSSPTATSSGSSSVSAVGQAIVIATASGSSGVSGIGGSLSLAAVASASGTSFADGSGRGLASGFGVAQDSGIASALAVGQPIAPARSAGSATVFGAGVALARPRTVTVAGHATVFGLGNGIHQGTASASGTSAVSGRGHANSPATATAAGSAVISGAGGVRIQGVATSSGSGDATGNPHPLMTGVASASGHGTASGFGGSLSPARTASASGHATANGVGSVAPFLAIASASGAGTASAKGHATLGGVASASGSGSASGVGRAIAKAKASAAGGATVSGIGIPLGIGMFSAAGRSSVNGDGASLANSIATASGISRQVIGRGIPSVATKVVNRRSFLPGRVGARTSR